MKKKWVSASQDPIQHHDVWALKMDMGLVDFQNARDKGKSLKSFQDQVT